MNEIALKDNKDIVYSSFVLQKNGLTPIGTPTFEQWQECGEFIKKANGACHFWIGDWLNYGEQRYGEMYTQALEETDYKYGTLANDKYVTDRVESSRRREDLSFAHHQEVADLKPNEQEELLDLAEKENLKSKEFREVVKKYKNRNLPKPILPDGKFDVIYADPPWKYDFSETTTREIENKYPTMEVEEICELKIPSADDSVLFLWATAPKLREALAVMCAWGFEYKTNAIWDKEIIGMGYWFRGQHELLLVGTRGKFPTPEESNRTGSVYKERRGEHSKKPEYFYSLIEKYFPEGKYLELFARDKHSDKWTAWGNQICETIK